MEAPRWEVRTNSPIESAKRLLAEEWVVRRSQPFEGVTGQQTHTGQGKEEVLRVGLCLVALQAPEPDANYLVKAEPRDIRRLQLEKVAGPKPPHEAQRSCLPNESRYRVVRQKAAQS
jgi:hypothetical protein